MFYAQKDVKLTSCTTAVQTITIDFNLQSIFLCIHTIQLYNKETYW